MRSRKSWLVFALALNFVIASCVSQPSEKAIQEAAFALLTEQALASTNTPLPTATFTPSPSPTPKPVELTLDELRQLSLQLTDMGSGYTLDSEEVLDITALRERDANRTADYLETVQPFSAIDTVFARGTLLSGANVRSRVIVLPSNQLASEYLHIHPTLFGNELELQPLSYAKAADETKAFLTTVSSGNFTIDSYFVMMRRENVVVAINYGTLSALGNLAELDTYVRTLEQRLLEMVP